MVHFVQVMSGVREEGSSRVGAVRLLRRLLTMHAYDTRLQSMAARQRVARLYLPLIGMCLDNITAVGLHSLLSALL
jgi:hypothetical protein